MGGKFSFFLRSIMLGVMFGVVNVFILHQRHASIHGGSGGGAGDILSSTTGLSNQQQQSQNRHLRLGRSIVNSANQTVPMLQTDQAAFLPTPKEFKELSHAHTSKRRQEKEQQKQNRDLAKQQTEAKKQEQQKQRQQQLKSSSLTILEHPIIQKTDSTKQQIHKNEQQIDQQPSEKKNKNKNKKMKSHQQGLQDSDVIHNTWTKERYICGIPIPPGGKIPLSDIFQDDTKCPPQNRFSRLWPINHVLKHNDYTGLEPIQLNWGGQKGGPVRSFKDCDVPCTYTGSEGGILRKLSVNGLPINFDNWSMEGEAYYHQLKLDPTLHKEHKYLATTSFLSDIPLPYYSEAEYDIQKGYPPVQFDDPKVIKGASFIAKNCGSKSHREDIVREMIALSGSPPVRQPTKKKTTKGKESAGKKNDTTTTNGTANATTAEETPVEPLLRIESVSSCLNNVDFPGVATKKKDDIMRSYLFHLSFENSNTDDYITEKLWGALRSGIVPVYHGAPNVKEHVPPNSVILMNEFNTTKDLVDYMTMVAHNKTLYESYHAWRFQELPDWFHAKYDMTRTHSVCRVCRFSWATKYGWGWNHTEQKVHDTRVSRTTCIHRDTGTFLKPFQEVWELDDGTVSIATPADAMGSDNGEDETSIGMDCNINQLQSLTIQGSSWVRTVSDHDGVTDVEITQVGSETPSANWKITIPIKSRELTPKKHASINGNHVYWIQDDVSRIVLAFDKDVNLQKQLPSEGQIEIPVSKPFRMRLLIVDLDINSFHEDGSSQQSHFESTMLDDFFNPLKVGTGSLQDWLFKNSTNNF